MVAWIVATYKSKSFLLSEASVGWRDEKATTEPVASIDGPPLGSIHASVAIAAHARNRARRAIEDEHVPEQIEIFRGHEIAGLGLKRHESAVGRHLRLGARAVGEAAPHAVRDDAGRARVQVCEEDVRHPVSSSRRMRRTRPSPLSDGLPSRADKSGDMKRRCRARRPEESLRHAAGACRLDENAT